MICQSFTESSLRKSSFVEKYCLKLEKAVS